MKLLSGVVVLEAVTFAVFLALYLLNKLTDKLTGYKSRPFLRFMHGVAHKWK